MRHGLTVVPVGLFLVVAAMMGAGEPGGPSSKGDPTLDERYGMRIAPIYLLLRGDVQADLELNPHQVNGARTLVSRLVERLLRVKGMPEQAARAERWAIDDEMAGWIRHELAEAQQERLTQISLQWEGALALDRPAVAEYLELDQQQQAALKRLLVEGDQRRRQGSFDPAEIEKLATRARAVLTAAQRQKWEAVLGTTCRFRFAGSPARAEGSAGDPRLKAPPRSPTR